MTVLQARLNEVQLSINVDTYGLSTNTYSKALVLVDGARFTRVIANLVSNALKFTPRGGIVTVSASIVQTGVSEKLSLRISVTDTGAGISKVDFFILVVN